MAYHRRNGAEFSPLFGRASVREVYTVLLGTQTDTLTYTGGNMRKLMALLGMAVLMACGSDSTAPPPAIQTGTVFFKIDALTCTGSGPVAFYLDGSLVGTETLAAGGTSKGYTSPAGSHVAGAKIPNTTYTWPNTTINVPANGSYTAILPCA
jgi:hypothetical protein